jgi:hypothetical protein
MKIRNLLTLFLGTFTFRLITSLQFEAQDLYVSDNCPVLAKPGDHLLFEYAFIYENGTESEVKVAAPSQLSHLILEKGDSSDVHAGMKGMCTNSTRLLKWSTIQNANFRPLIETNIAALLAEGGGLSLKLHVRHITEPRDYSIFDAFRSGNWSMVLDIIEEGRGINAVDEWGQTPLMMATQKDVLQVAAALLNARRPKVDVNIAKSVSDFTCSRHFLQFLTYFHLFYIVWFHGSCICHAVTEHDYHAGSPTKGSRSECRH